MHALWSCPLIAPIWSRYAHVRKIIRYRPASIIEVISSSFHLYAKATFTVFSFSLWLIWNRRNKALYQNELDPIDALIPLAVSLSNEYLESREQACTTFPA